MASTAAAAQRPANHKRPTVDTGSFSTADTGAGVDVRDRQPSDPPEDEELGNVVSPALSQGSIGSPPYWSHSSGHQRTISNMSSDSVLPLGAITLRDNETNEHNDRNNACWAKSVEIRDHTIVNSSATNIGAFVVWIIRVETLSVCYDGRASLLCMFHC